jgi:glucose/arabinose dehydrogenase
LSPLFAAAALSGLTGSAQGQYAPAKTHLRPADLPKPFATPSANNAGKIVARPEGADLTLPPGFKAEVFAEDFQFPRGIAVAPCGDVFVAEASAGRITVLRPGSDGKPAKREVFVEDIRRPFGIVFWKDGMYVGTPNAVLRYAYKDGQMQAEGDPQTIVSGLPTEGHWTRTLAQDPRTGKMYISIGSSKDVGEESDARRATICEFNPDGSGFRIYATGLRNVVGMAFHPQSKKLWASVQERDFLGDDLVPDYVTSVQEGGFYGWPWYYIGANLDPRMTARPELAAKSLTPEVLLTSHTAAMCMVFYTGTQFPKEYRNDAYVALHGSSNRSKRVGYSIVRVRFKNGKPVGGYEDFVTGWMMGENDPRVWGRPVGIAQGKDGSLFLTDDGANKVWRIYYQK